MSIVSVFVLFLSLSASSRLVIVPVYFITFPYFSSFPDAMSFACTLAVILIAVLFVIPIFSFASWSSNIGFSLSFLIITVFAGSVFLPATSIALYCIFVSPSLSWSVCSIIILFWSTKS